MSGLLRWFGLLDEPSEPKGTITTPSEAVEEEEPERDIPTRPAGENINVPPPREEPEEDEAEESNLTGKVPEIYDVRPVYTGGGGPTDSRVDTWFKVSVRVSVRYAGPNAVEVAEFALGENPDHVNAEPARSVLIPQKYNFELDDIDEASFDFYKAEKEDGFVYQTPSLQPIQHEVRYFAREAVGDERGAWGPPMIAQVRYAPVEDPDTEVIRPKDGVLG